MNNKIQIISLAPDSETSIRLLNDLKSQGLEATFFPAIDGRKKMPELEHDEYLDQAQSLDKRFIPLTDTEVACYLSHFRAIKQAYEDNVGALCLLEEDIHIEENFGEVLNQVLGLDEKFEFVRLMGLKRHKYKILKQLDETTALVRPVKGLCGAQGYVINKKGMQLMLEKGSRIHEPIDKFYDHFWEHDLKSFAIINHIIWEEPSPSTIAKKSRTKSARGIAAKLKLHWMKLCRSINRNIYLMRHWNEFRPAQRPARYLGRTTRIH